jgi:ParB/RepB/Spo0J family partition protein
MVGKPFIDALRDFISDMSFQEIPLERLVISPQNVRRELGDIADLKASIAKEGMLQPVLVRPSKEKGLYEVVVGRRRFEAAKQLGLKSIPAIVKELDDETARIESLVENIHRRSLSPMEEAEEIRRYWQKLGSLRRVAEVLGISHTYVAEKLHLLGLSPDVEGSIRIAGKPSKEDRETGKAVPAKHAAIIAKAISKAKSELSPTVQSEILKRVAPLTQADVRKVAAKLAEEADRIMPERIPSFIDEALRKPLKRVRGARLIIRLTWEDREALERAARKRRISIEKAVVEAIRLWLKSV